MSYLKNNPRSSKQGIFDSSTSYRSPVRQTNSALGLSATSPQLPKQSFQGIRQNTEGRDNSVFGGNSAQYKAWANPMFDQNASTISQKKVKVFDEPEREDEGMRSTHVNAKLYYEGSQSLGPEDFPKDRESKVTRATYTTIPSAMRPTISNVSKMATRDSNIPQERRHIVSGKEGQPLQPFFKNKKVVVTGASSGIGRGTAIWFLNAGAKVALIGRDWESLSQIGEEFPEQAMAIKCDLTRDEQLYDMCNAIITVWKGIDILINCAGVYYEGDIKSMWPQDYDYLMDINIRSSVQLIQLFRPYIIESKGSIVNVSCIAGSRPFAGMYAYCMSKAGIEALTKSLALDFAAHGVRINAVSPGFVDTNLLTYRDLDRSEIDTIYKNSNKNTPLGRLATVEDVARTIVFLCSNVSRHMTGQILKIDGARSLTSSGWVRWEGMNNMTEAMEQSKASIVKKVKNFFKEQQKKTILTNPTPKQLVEDRIKYTNWGTSDKNAHITISSSTYKNIHDDDDAQDQTVGDLLSATKTNFNQDKRIF